MSGSTTVASAAADTICEGTVSVDPNATFMIRLVNTGVDVEISCDSPLGALDAAAKAGNFSYEVWEASWGYFVYSIDAVTVAVEENETILWWIYDVEAKHVTNDATYNLRHNDEELRII